MSAPDPAEIAAFVEALLDVLLSVSHELDAILVPLGLDA